MDPAIVLQTAVLVLIAYLAGSVPVGVLVARRAGGADPRTIGSGRTGGTNALRALGPRWAAVVVAGDLLKGILPVLLARFVTGDPLVEVLCGAAAVAGAIWSVFSGFRSGRGVGTGVGTMLVIQPVAVLLATPVFIGVILLTRYVSLGSLIGSAAMFPAMLLVLLVVPETPLPYVIYSAVGAALIWLAHADNIDRLIHGTERKFDLGLLAGKRSGAAEEQVVSAAALVLSVALLVLIAVEVPWTATAVLAWLLTVPALLASAMGSMPLPLRVGVAVLVVAWALVLVFPGRSPIGPLSRAERACQRVIKGISVGARAAYQAGALEERRADFVGQLAALEPPNDVWRAVKAAQLLDLRADPPQVGVGDATNRLVTWPWRDALDHRVLRIRIRIDDAVRARKVRHVKRPGFDDMTSSMRYDYFFLRTVWARYNDLKSREGGLRGWHEDVAALADLTGVVRPPDERWARLRDVTVEIIGLELGAATAGLSTIEEERLATAGDALRGRWADLSARDARSLAPRLATPSRRGPRGDPEVTNPALRPRITVDPARSRCSVV